MNNNNGLILNSARLCRFRFRKQKFIKIYTSNNVWGKKKFLKLYSEKCIKILCRKGPGGGETQAAVTLSWIFLRSVSPGVLYTRRRVFFLRRYIIIFQRGNGFAHKLYLPRYRVAGDDFLPCASLYSTIAKSGGGDMAARLLVPARCRFFRRGNRNALSRQIIGFTGRAVGGGPKGKNSGLDWPLQGCARPTLKCPRPERGVYTGCAANVNYSMHGFCLQ